MSTFSAPQGELPITAPSSKELTPAERRTALLRAELSAGTKEMKERHRSLLRVVKFLSCSVILLCAISVFIDLSEIFRLLSN